MSRLRTTTDPQNNRQINISPDLARALSGHFGGYTICFHAMPGWVFKVEAETADLAHAAAVLTCHQNGRPLAQTGATIQRVEQPRPFRLRLALQQEG